MQPTLAYMCGNSAKKPAESRSASGTASGQMPSLGKGQQNRQYSTVAPSLQYCWISSGGYHSYTAHRDQFLRTTHPRSCSKRPMRVDLPASTCPSTTRCSLGGVCSAAVTASQAVCRSLSSWYSSSRRFGCLEADTGLELPAEVGSARKSAGSADWTCSLSISVEAPECDEHRQIVSVCSSRPQT